MKIMTINKQYTKTNINEHNMIKYICPINDIVDCSIPHINNCKYCEICG